MTCDQCLCVGHSLPVPGDGNVDVLISHNGALNFYEGDSASVFVGTALAGTVAATAVYMLDLDGGAVNMPAVSGRESWSPSCAGHCFFLHGVVCLKAALEAVHDMVVAISLYSVPYRFVPRCPFLVAGLTICVHCADGDMDVVAGCPGLDVYANTLCVVGQYSSTGGAPCTIWYVRGSPSSGAPLLVVHRATPTTVELDCVCVSVGRT